MNALPAQANLESILSSPALSAGETMRYRHLNLYFQVTKDFASINQSDNPADLYQKYSRVIDSTTGTWQSWFRDFTRNEGLTLPLPPLRVPFSRADVPRGEIAELAARYRQSIGPNPVQFFQTERLDGARHVEGILESMRKVKAQIRLLEYTREGGKPVFDWFSAQNRPDLEASGLLPIGRLTSYYFFARDESGAYVLDEPNEEVIRQRVQAELTNEELFYVIDIEHWELEGDAGSVEASLQKLGKVTSLLHKYNPNLLIGMYRLLPSRDPNAAYAGTGSEMYEEWQQHNDQLAASLGGSVDVLYPSTYVLHLGEHGQTTEERWAVYAMNSIQEARRIANGKPVIPFLSLYYHPNGVRDASRLDARNVKGWQWVEPELLLHQLMVVDEWADGVVLYNDLPVDWSTLVDHHLLEPIDMLQTAKSAGRSDLLRTHYEQLVRQRHPELLAKLEAETSLGQKLQDLRQARIDSDTQRINSLTQEIDQLREQLEGMIDFWELLTEGWIQADPPAALLKTDTVLHSYL